MMLICMTLLMPSLNCRLKNLQPLHPIIQSSSQFSNKSTLLQWIPKMHGDQASSRKTRSLKQMISSSARRQTTWRLEPQIWNPRCHTYALAQVHPEIPTFRFWLHFCSQDCVVAEQCGCWLPVFPSYIPILWAYSENAQFPFISTYPPKLVRAPHKS
jgi:hypothetical protein